MSKALESRSDYDEESSSAVDIAIDLEGTIEDNNTPTAEVAAQTLENSSIDRGEVEEVVSRHTEEENLEDIRNYSWGFEPWMDILAELRNWDNLEPSNPELYMFGEHQEKLFDGEVPNQVKSYGNEWAGFFQLMDHMFLGNPEGFELYDDDTAYYINWVQQKEESGRIDVVTSRTDAERFIDGDRSRVSDDLYEGMREFLEHAGIIGEDGRGGIGVIDGFFVEDDKTALEDEEGGPRYRILVDDNPEMFEDIEFGGGKPEQMQIVPPDTDYSSEAAPSFSEIYRGRPFEKMREYGSPVVVADSKEDASYFERIESALSFYTEAMARFRR